MYPFTVGSSAEGTDHIGRHRCLRTSHTSFPPKRGLPGQLGLAEEDGILLGGNMQVEAGTGEGHLKPHLCLLTEAGTHIDMHITESLSDGFSASVSQLICPVMT